MKKFIIIPRINGIDYLTTVEAETLGGAEHKALDMGICGRSAYGVEGCMAFDEYGMKTDTFISMALNAIPIEFNRLAEIITNRNNEIRRDEIKNKIASLKKELARLEA